MPPRRAPRAVDDGPFWKVLLPATVGAVVASYLLRVYWRELHDLFQSYPSDIWYMHINYSWFLVNQGFFGMEYPAGMFAFVKAMAVICKTCFPMVEPHARFGGFLYRYEDWLLVNSLALGLASLGITWCMHRLDAEFFHLRPHRLLTGFVLTPSFVFFSLFNYDGLPILCCVAALLALLRRDEVTSFMLLGIGTAVKIFPGVLVPLFLLAVPRGRRLASLGWWLGAWAAVNLPFLYLNPDAWSFPYRWQMGFDSADQTGRMLFTLTSNLGKLPALALVGGASLLALERTRRTAPPDPLEDPVWMARASLVLVTLFIFTKNVFSPQYLFWLLPLATLGTAYPFGGLATLVELVNVAEAFRLDYWRSGHEGGLVAIRLVRDLGLAALLASTLRLLWRRPAKGGKGPGGS